MSTTPTSGAGSMGRGFSIVVLTVGLIACGKTVASAPRDKAASALTAGEVTAARVAGGIEIVNGSNGTITYVVSNRGWLGLLAPCTDKQAACPTLAPGARAVVAEAAMYGNESGGASEALVSWWTVPGTSDDVHQIIVRM